MSSFEKGRVEMRSEKLSRELEIVNEFEHSSHICFGADLLLKEIQIVGGQEGLSIFIQNVTHPLESTTSFEA